MKKGQLYLIPVFLGENRNADLFFPPENIAVLHGLKHFIAEDSKALRRFLKAIAYPNQQEELHIQLLNEHSKHSEEFTLVEPLLSGNSVGLVSDAGCPGVADPGSVAVRAAHKFGIKVKPLVGPSSLLLALMASGLSGQRFVFHGYLPIDAKPLEAKLKEMTRAALQFSQTQLFIETPYRNAKIFSTLVKLLPPDFLLSISCNIGEPDEFLKTEEIGFWRNFDAAKLHKKPCVFCFGKSV